MTTTYDPRADCAKEDHETESVMQWTASTYADPPAPMWWVAVPGFGEAWVLEHADGSHSWALYGPERRSHGGYPTVASERGIATAAAAMRRVEDYRRDRRLEESIASEVAS